MPQSIYDNGGIIGATLDFADTEQYITGYQSGASAPSFIGATTLSGSGNLSLPSGLQQDDLVMVFMADDNNNGGSAPSGWTTLVTENFTNSVWNSVWYKFMGSTPDSTVSVPEVSAWIAVAFRNVDTTTPFDVTYQGPDTGSGSTIPIPSITTSSDNAMLVAFGGLDDDRTASSTTVGSPWTLAAAEDNDGVAMVAYYLKATAGTQSGGSFSTSSDAWVSYVFALKGGSGLIPIFGNQKNSGIWSLSSIIESYVPPVPGINFVSSSIGTTSVSIPGDAQDGDVGLLIEYSSNPSGIPTDVTESGFTQLTTQEYDSGNDFRLSVSYKMLSASDAGASITGLAGSNHNNKLFIIFRPDETFSSINIFDIGFQATTGTANSIDLTPTEDSGIFFFVKGAYGGSGDPTITISGVPQSTQINTTTDNTGRLGAEFYSFTENYPLVTGSTADDGNAQMFLGFYLVGVS